MGKFIGCFILTRDIQTKWGQALPKGALGVHCERHGPDDMFTRVRFCVDEEHLVYSGLVLAEGDPLISEEQQADWGVFPQDAMLWVVPSEVEGLGALPESVAYLEELMRV